MAILLFKRIDAFHFLFQDRRALVLFMLGVSAGIPLLLIFSSLSLWLKEAGVERSAVTFFSWAALAYHLNLFGHLLLVIYPSLNCLLCSGRDEVGY